jgi:hypothetical protein
MYVGGSCVDEVACCDHTRVKCECEVITWARCTRVAAVRAPKGSLHRSDQSRSLCACSVRATVQEALNVSACVCEEKEYHRPGLPKP